MARRTDCHFDEWSNWTAGSDSCTSLAKLNTKPQKWNYRSHEEQYTEGPDILTGVDDLSKDQDSQARLFHALSYRREKK